MEENYTSTGVFPLLRARSYSYPKVCDVAVDRQIQRGGGARIPKQTKVEKSRKKMSVTPGPWPSLDVATYLLPRCCGHQYIQVLPNQSNEHFQLHHQKQDPPKVDQKTNLMDDSCSRLNGGPWRHQVLVPVNCDCDFIWEIQLRILRWLWIIQVGLKHNHQTPNKKEAEGGFPHIDEEKAMQDRSSDVAISQAMLAALGAEGAETQILPWSSGKGAQHRQPSDSPWRN